MDDRLQLRIQRYGWDAAAPVYEHEWREHLGAAQALLVEALSLVQGQTVIETAAGSGLITIALADAVGPHGRVVATDISGEMIMTCARAAAEAGSKNVACTRENAEDVSFDDASFDRAACCLGLMYMPNPDKALAEMQRVLRAGGRAAVAVWGERRNCGWAEIFPITDKQVQSEVCPMFFGLGAPGALVSEMERAGFSDIDEQRINVTMRFTSPERLLSAVIDGGAVAMAAKRFSADTRKTVDQQFLASVASFAVGSGFEIPGEFVVVSGTA